MGNAFNYCQCISLVPNGHSADPVKNSGVVGEAGAGICPRCLCRPQALGTEAVSDCALSLTELEPMQGFSEFLKQKCRRRWLIPKPLLSSEQRKCISLALCLPKFLPEQVTGSKGLYSAILFRKAVFKNNHLLLQSFGETFGPIGLSLSLKTQLSISKAARE